MVKSPPTTRGAARAAGRRLERQINNIVAMVVIGPEPSREQMQRCAVVLQWYKDVCSSGNTQVRFGESRGDLTVVDLSGGPWAAVAACKTPEELAACGDLATRLSSLRELVMHMN